MRKAIPFLPLLALLLTALAAAQGVPGVTETCLGRIPDLKLEGLSPSWWSGVVEAHGWDLACATPHDKGWQIWLNGQRGPVHESIGKGSLGFSRVGRHLVYAAKQEGKWFVVVDGQPAALRFDSIGRYCPVLSRDGKRVAYAARQGLTWSVVVDGQAGPQYDAIGEGTIVFSPDNARLAYSAKQGKKWVVVMDGTPGPQYDKVGAVLFSPDGKRTAYWAMKGKKCLVVVDGQEGPEIAECDPLDISFSKDSRRVVYCGGPVGRGFVVVDGQVQPYQPRYDPYQGYVVQFSSQHVLYAAYREGKQCVVLNGQAGALYDEVRWPDISPDGKRVGYAAKQGKQWFAVVDELAGPGFDHVQSITFSPDSTRVAYQARQGNDWLMVTDGKPGPAYPRWDQGGIVGPSVGEPRFSADSQHLTYDVWQNKEWFTAVDGQLGPTPPKVTLSPDGKRITETTTPEKKVCVAIDDKVGAPYDIIRCLTFTSGGRVVYLGRRKGHWILVVDGQEAGEYRAICTATSIYILDRADNAGGPWIDENALYLSFQPDGTLDFLATKSEHWLSDGDLYRVTIAPR